MATSSADTSCGQGATDCFVSSAMTEAAWVQASLMVAGAMRGGGGCMM
jgi:hypothetical protein